MAIVTMKQLLETGVHFGHRTRRWNPQNGTLHLHRTEWRPHY